MKKSIEETLKNIENYKHDNFYLLNYENINEIKNILTDVLKSENVTKYTLSKQINVTPQNLNTRLNNYQNLEFYNYLFNTLGYSINIQVIKQNSAKNDFEILVNDGNIKAVNDNEHVSINNDIDILKRLETLEKKIKIIEKRLF